MDAEKWKEANEKVTVEQIMNVWADYAKTHDPTVLVMAKPLNDKEIKMAAITDNDPDREQIVTQQKAEGLVPFGFIGIPNIHHEGTTSLLCINATLGFSSEFVEDALQNIAADFEDIRPFTREMTGNPDAPTMAWLVSPDAERELVGLANSAMQGNNPDLFAKMQKLEKEKRALRWFGNPHTEMAYRAFGYKAFYMQSAELLAQTMAEVEASGHRLDVKFTPFGKDLRKMN